MNSTKVQNSEKMKINCSYGGKILPRHPDGKLRYTGGETRVVAVDQTITYTDLLFKLAELYGSAVSFRCQLPQYDLDSLVSVTSNEDLANVIEEYNLANKALGTQLKMRVFLCPLKSVKKVSPSSSPTSVMDFSARKYIYQPMVSNTVRFQVNRTRISPQSYYSGGSCLRQSHVVHTGCYWQ